MTRNKNKLAILSVALTCFGCSAIHDEAPMDSTNGTTVLYSWVEAYADGTLDTIFATDTATYPGSDPLPMEYMSTPSVSSDRGRDSITIQSYQDTIFLNYGPEARDFLVIPRVTIENKAEILAGLDTLSQGPMFPSYPIQAHHFKADGLVADFSDTALMAFSISPTTQMCTGNPCQLGDAECTWLSYRPLSYSSALMMRIPLGSSNHSSIHWRMILRNRFGFADTLEGTSYLAPLNCEEVSFMASTCRSLSVSAHDADTLFTWVEHFANGHEDTLWSKDKSTYPGPHSLQLFNGAYLADRYSIIRIPSDTLVCPGDSVWIDAQAIVHWKPQLKDTLYLNYGTKARDAFIEPRVSIANKASILAEADTAQFFAKDFKAEIDIQHFAGDSASFDITPSSAPIQLAWSHSVGGCTSSNICDSTAPQLCIAVDWINGITNVPTLSVNSLDSTSSGNYPWKIIAHNRFGYADTLEGSTQILPFSCAQ